MLIGVSVKALAKRYLGAVSRRGRRARWMLLGSGYTLAVKIRPQADRPRFRLGRARERLGDWPAAEASFEVAAKLGPREATYHAALGRAATAGKRWDDAIEHYEEALRLSPGTVPWTRALAESLLKAGDPVAALAVADDAIANEAETRRLIKLVASAAEAIGQWDRASETLRELLADKPDNYSFRARLAQCLERCYLVPFVLNPDGTPVPSAARQEDYEEAVQLLRHIVEHNPERAHPAYRLGYLHERSGDLSAAAEAYQTATERLARIDAAWAHKAAKSWQFRLDYVARDAGDHDDERLLTAAEPVADSAMAADTPESGGFFEAHIRDVGLQIDGLLTPDNTDVVDIRLDGRLLKRVTPDTRQHLPAFGYLILHDALIPFPKESDLTVWAGSRQLVTTGGATVIRLSVPSGVGELGRLLDAGRDLTKKGAWALTEVEKSERQRAWLDVYDRTREVLEEHSGKHLFLFYGTLLGCHRDGGFIPGDDDFDVAYLTDATTPQDLKRELLETSLMLLRNGLDVSFADNGRMVKVGIDGVWIDISPLWFFQNRAWAFAAHDLRHEDFGPAVQVTFAGHAAYQPNDTEAFLAENYGPDWRTPDSGFRYYRPAADRKILERTWLTPSEVRDFSDRAERVSAADPVAGRFAGLGVLEYPAYRG